MDDGRYAMTLDEVSAEIIAIRQTGVPCGLIQPRMEAGYLLTDGTALLESEKDENGSTSVGPGWTECISERPSGMSRCGTIAARSRPSGS